MISEEAYNRIDAIIAKHEIDDEYVTITNSMDYDALRMARELLEQEPILDKIRAEIEASRWTDKDIRIERNALASGLEAAIEIIDKYKGESGE